MLKKLFDEDKSKKWPDLYDGAFEGHYPSPSEAAAAFLRKVAFYSGNDPVQMERIIRKSGLASEKFDSTRGGSTWLQNEIASAIEDTSDTYSAKRGKKKSGEKGTPTHDQLRDCWLEENPNCAFGLGEWR